MKKLMKYIFYVASVPFLLLAVVIALPLVFIWLIGEKTDWLDELVKSYLFPIGSLGIEAVYITAICIIINSFGL